MTGIYSSAPKARKVPLSQASGKKKLLIGVPVSLIGAVLWAFDLPFGMMLCVTLGAYAIVGLIEVIGGDSLKTTAAKWDTLQGWKKFLIAAVFICAIFLAIGLMLPILAQ